MHIGKITPNINRQHLCKVALEMLKDHSEYQTVHQLSIQCIRNTQIFSLLISYYDTAQL